MTARKWIGVSAAGLLIAGMVGGGWAINAGRKSRADGLRAQALIDETRGILQGAEDAKLLVLAADSFATARGESERASVLLGAGQGREALPIAEQGLAHAKSALAEAQGKTPVARAATLRSFRNAVLYRAASAVDWSDVKTGMSLFDRDRISTKQSSAAIVRFEEGNEMKVEENSVMVVERYTHSRVDPTVAMTLSVPEGSVRSMIAREGGRDVKLEINLPHAGVVIDTARTRDGRAEIAAGVGADRSERVAVYTGEARMVSPAGDSVILHQNQYATLTPDGKLTPAQELPSAAIILLPGRNAVVYTSQQRPEVTFKWSATGSCSGYRLEVATDIDFLDLLVDERVKRTAFTYGNLKPGKYWWRMSCLGADGAQGAYSETSLFDVRVDNDAPSLAILAPKANAVLGQATVEARCKTESGASVFINGEEARAEGGEFRREVALNPGLNTLVFEAVDAAGNVIYNSLLVTRR